jgi:hypothetical protein
MVSVEVDDNMWSYLNDSENAASFGDLVVELDQEKNNTFVHLCDTLDERFYLCDLLNYSLAEFTVYPDRLVHQRTAYVFLSTSYFIRDDSVYVCVTNGAISNDGGLHWITVIGLSLSNLFLVLTLLTYLLLPKLQTNPGKLIMNLSAILFIAQMIFLVVMIVNDMGAVCQFLAIISHYSWLSVFFWMNSIVISTNRTFRNILSRSSAKQLVIFSIYSYGILLVIVAICVSLHFTDTVLAYAGGLNGDVHPGICWIYSQPVLLVAFIIPLALIVLCNVALFTLTAVTIMRTRTETAAVTRSSIQSRDIIVYIKLSNTSK